MLYFVSAFIHICLTILFEVFDLKYVFCPLDSICIDSCKHLVPTSLSQGLLQYEWRDFFLLINVFVDKKKKKKKSGNSVECIPLPCHDQNNVWCGRYTHATDCNSNIV